MSDLYDLPVATEPDPPKRTNAVLLVAVLAALLLVVGVVVAAVGKDDSTSPENAAALLSNAPDAVRDAKSARIEMAMKMKAGAGMDLDVHGAGATEFATGRGTFSMSILGTDIEMVTDGSTLYMRVPEGGQLPGTTKPWVAMPATSFKGQSSFGSVESATSFLDALRGVGTQDIEELGTEEVNGVQATHYRAVISLTDAIANAPEAQRAQAEQGLAQLEQLGAGEMPVDVWVTKDGLPVRQILTFDAKGGGVMPPLSMEVRIDLSDFGAPVDVQVPPSDQVQQLDDPSQLGELFTGGGLS